MNAAIGLLLAALPFLISGFARADDFPALLSYLLFPGRAVLQALGLIVIAWALKERLAIGSETPTLRSSIGRPAVIALGFVVACWLSVARVPQAEREAEAFGGDEPKYLRIAYSLLRDADADISGGRTETPPLAVRVQQLRNLALGTRDAVAGLFRPVEVPETHVWNAGNWTVRGLNGGLYHLQPPGLPALVAIALGLGEGVFPHRDPGLYVAYLLSLIWILAAVQLFRLAHDITADQGVAALFVCLALLSAPLFIGGYQLFPESLCLLVFPWIYRHLRASGRALSPLLSGTCGLASGYLLWVHPKLTFVAAYFVVLAMLRPATSRGARAAFFAGFVPVAFLALLYCHQISGLFRPEGLYIRQAEEYVGSPNPLSLRFAAGLVKALVGGRDGLFVFAPVLVLGFLTLDLRTRLPRYVLELGTLFGLVWLTSAVHDGASLGSPARLMAPVAFIPALLLAQSLLADEARPRFRAAATWLFLVGLVITAEMSSDWRKNVNPYRGMFANSATNFEPDLPGNSFSEMAYATDLVKGAFILACVLAAGALLRRTPKEAAHATPALFGGGVLLFIAILSYGLRCLTPPS